MAKHLTIRGRVNDVLKKRMAKYIADENAKGRSIDESSIVRDATVEYLDARNVPVPPVVEPEKDDTSNSPSPAAAAVQTAKAVAYKVTRRKKTTS